MKRIFTLFLLSLLGFNTQAQISLGIKGGLNASNILFPSGSNKISVYTPNDELILTSDKEALYYDYKTNFFKMFNLGANAGFFVKIPLKKRFDFLQIELNFEEKGFDLKSEQTRTALNFREIERFERKVQNKYITLPILVGNYFGKKKQFYYELGVFASYLLASKFTVYDSRITNTVIVVGPPFYEVDTMITSVNRNEQSLASIHEKDAKMHNRFDVGLVGGIGYTYNFNEKLGFIANLRTNVSILKLGKFNNEYEETIVASSQSFEYLIKSRNYMYGLNSQARNISFNFSVGLQYKL